MEQLTLPIVSIAAAGFLLLIQGLLMHNVKQLRKKHKEMKKVHDKAYSELGELTVEVRKLNDGIVSSQSSIKKIEEEEIVRLKIDIKKLTALEEEHAEKGATHSNPTQGEQDCGKE